MKLGINGISMRYASLESDLDVASNAGYKYLELWWPKIGQYLKSNSLQNLAQTFQQHNVKPASLTSIEEFTFRDNAGRKELAELVKEMSNVCQAVHCPMLEVVPSKMIPGLTQKKIVEETVSVLCELAEIMYPYGIKLAFEFVGARDYTVNSLELALEVMQKVDSLDVGLVIDTFHFYNSRSTIELISRLKSEQIFLVHIADSGGDPVTDLSGDKYRLLPGEGVIPIRDILIALKETGYAGVASFESLRPAHWDMNPLQLATEAKNKIASLFSDLIDVT